MLSKIEKKTSLNQQIKMKKSIKEHRVNANFTNLCYMSEKQKKIDENYYKNGQLNNYFTSEFKKLFKVHRINNSLYFKRYNNFIPLKSGGYGFVVSPQGSLYAVRCDDGIHADKAEIQNPRFIHSLFLAGQPVQVAGFFIYNSKNGEIETIYRDSGHYKPTFEQLRDASLGLVRSGFLSMQTKLGGMSFKRGNTYSLQNIVDNAIDYRDIQTISIEAPQPTMSIAKTQTISSPPLSSSSLTSTSSVRTNTLTKRYVNYLENEVTATSPRSIDRQSQSYTVKYPDTFFNEKNTKSDASTVRCSEALVTMNPINLDNLKVEIHINDPINPSLLPT